MHVDTTFVRTFVPFATAQIDERVAAAHISARDRRRMINTRPVYLQLQSWLDRHPDTELTLPSGWCSSCDALPFLVVLNAMYGFGDGITSQWAAWYAHHQLMTLEPARPDRWEKNWRKRLTGKLGKHISAPGSSQGVLTYPRVHEALTGHCLPNHH